MPIPSKFCVYGAILLAVVLTWAGSMWWAYDKGKAVDHEAWQASITDDAVAQANRVQASSIITTKIVTQYVDRVQVVLTQGATITKEITHVITPDVDREYHVPYGLIRVLNSAASGQSLDASSAGPTDAASAPVTLSDTAGVIADNYTICRANAEQLTALQDWLRKQQQVTQEKSPH